MSYEDEGLCCGGNGFLWPQEISQLPDDTSTCGLYTESAICDLQADFLEDLNVNVLG